MLSDSVRWVAYDIPFEKSSEPVVWWIGHASFLIQIAGINVLIDPIFGRASFLFKRLLPPGVPLHVLPAIDVILISHNHWDHMDYASLKAVAHSKPRILVPHGDKRWLDKHGFANTTEHMWWDQVVVGADQDSTGSVRFTFLPSVHWSGRGLFDKNRSLWGSWMIEANGHCIYFAGDTAYSDHFSAIVHEFPSIDIALMPIGPCEPRGWMQRTHLSAEQSTQAFIDLQAQHFIPMHWGTFSFGTDHFLEPINRLQDAWEKMQGQLSERKLHMIKVGQRVVFEK